MKGEGVRFPEVPPFFAERKMEAAGVENRETWGSKTNTSTNTWPIASGIQGECLPI
jgi:hypothetical protein